MFSTKAAFAIFLALATSALVLPAPQSPAPPTNDNTFCDADLSLIVPATLPESVNITLEGVLTPTKSTDAPDQITSEVPVNVDCYFFNTELVVTLHARVTEVTVSPSQVLPSGMCQPSTRD